MFFFISFYVKTVKEERSYPIIQYPCWYFVTDLNHTMQSGPFLRYVPKSDDEWVTAARPAAYRAITTRSARALTASGGWTLVQGCRSWLFGGQNPQIWPFPTTLSPFGPLMVFQQYWPFFGPSCGPLMVWTRNMNLFVLKIQKKLFFSNSGINCLKNPRSIPNSRGVRFFGPFLPPVAQCFCPFGNFYSGSPALVSEWSVCHPAATGSSDHRVLYIPVK